MEIIGAPDVYPEYSDDIHGFDLSRENNGHEWIEIMFDTPVFIDKIEVYETYKPGAIYKISSAKSYDDDNTAHW